MAMYLVFYSPHITDQLTSLSCAMTVIRYSVTDVTPFVTL